VAILLDCCLVVVSIDWVVMVDDVKEAIVFN